MTKSEAINTISEGLILDLDPLQTPNNALTNCLNGTLLTFNGNENVLLNDMGNARVETAMLPNGYIPLGTTSFGGIIYIVSLNPMTKEYLIGSFPSPERNLSKDELGDVSNTYINLDKFCDVNGWLQQGSNGWSAETVLTSYYLKTDLTRFKVYPSDKYKVFSLDIKDAQHIISAWKDPSISSTDNPGYIKFDIVSTLDSGETTVLTDDSVWTAPNPEDNPYYIYADNITLDFTGKVSLPEYRNLVSSNYDVYLFNTSGKLGIAATLEVPTSFSAGYDVITNSIENDVIDILFYFYLNWANNKTGKYKYANNPNRVNIKFVTSNNEIDLGNNYLILLHILGEKHVAVLPNNLKPYVYTTTIPPEDYLTDNWNIAEYLKKGENCFDHIPRKNDGTDFPYLIKGPKITYYRKEKLFIVCDEKSSNCKEVVKDGVINLKVTPIMPFGKLQFLELTISVNLDKLQTGELYLNSYQYQVNNSTIDMDFNIEAYPELGKSFTKLTIELYPLDLHSNKWFKQETYDNEDYTPKVDALDEEGIVKEITPSEGVNGTHHITFDKNNLEQDEIYIVKFIIDYFDSTVEDDLGTYEKNESITKRVFYRLLFNNDTFNESYGSTYDFKDLKLYSANLKGGIKPTFKFDLTVNNTSSNIKTVNGVVIPNEDNFPLYKENISESEKITHIYEIKHEIDSTYSIDSGVGDRIKLEIDRINFNNAHADYVSDCNLRNALYTQTIIENDNKFQLNNTFLLEADYTVDYSDSEELDIYNLEALKPSNTKVRMSLWLKNTKLGHMSLWFNDKWKNEDYEYRYMNVDEQKGLICYSDPFETRLQRVLDEELCDYILAVFGVEEFQDGDAGYGYDDSNRQYYYKKSWDKCHYILVDVVRKSDGNIAIIHTDKFNLPDDQFNTTTTLINYDTWNKDYDLIKLYYANKESQVIKNTYKKYVKSGKSKTLFYIKNIDSNELLVDTTYTINVNIEGIRLTIKDSAGNTKTTDGIVGLANNFIVDTIEGTNVIVPFTNTINNKDLLYKATHRDSLASGWYNGSILKQEDLYKVFDGNIPLTTMALRENDRMLYYKDTKLDKVTWYFGWEEMGGNKGQEINASDFNSCRLSFDFKCTYKTRE